MSHIAEGLLHAHLDGALGTDRAEEWLLAEAHLGVCEDCRRRLDEARRFREAAGALLAGASSPVLDRPGFDRLVSLAVPGPATLPNRRPWWTSTSRLAWAASLMLAVGAGWLGRELLIQTGRPVPAIVTTKQEAAPTTEMLDRLAADDALEAQLENEAPPETDAVRGALGERRDEATAEEPRAANAPVVSDLQKSQAEEFQAHARQDRDEVGGQFADEVAAGGNEEAARRAAALQIREPVVAAECYAIAAPSADPAGREGAAGAAVDRKMAGADIDAASDRLRLAPDGTATASVDGRNLNGTWVSDAGDSLTVALSGPEGGVELRLARVEFGMSGSMSTKSTPSDKAAPKAQGVAGAEAGANAIGGYAGGDVTLSIALTPTACDN